MKKYTVVLFLIVVQAAYSQTWDSNVKGIRFFAPTPTIYNTLYSPGQGVFNIGNGVAGTMRSFVADGTATDIDLNFVPKGTGGFIIPIAGIGQDNALTRVLVQHGSTGKFFWRDATTFGSSGSFWNTTGTTNIVTPSIVGDPNFAGNVNITGKLFVATSGSITANVVADVKGTGLGSGTYSYYGRNSSDLRTFAIRDDGALIVGSSANKLIASTADGTSVGNGGAGFMILTDAANLSNVPSLNIRSGSIASAAVSRIIMGIGVGTSFSVSSASGELNNLLIGPTYNTTGTYAGTIRGIYYNPTVTSLTGAAHLAYHATSGNMFLANSSSDVISANTKLEIRSVGSGSSSFGLRVIAANGNGTFRVRDDGALAIGDQGVTIAATNGSVASNVGRNVVIGAGDEGQIGDKIVIAGGNFATNSGSTRYGLTKISGTIRPVSGSAPHAALTIEPIFNQTGTFTGTTHGIYYNPTLTSVLGTHVAFENVSGQLRFGALTQDDTKTRLLAVDNTTNQVFYRDATTILPTFGTAGQIPFINGTNNDFSYDSDNKFILGTNIFTTGQNLTISQAGGVIDNVTMLGLDHLISNNGSQIRWATLIGEANKITSTSATGHIANPTLVGGNSNEIKNNGTFAVFNPTIFGAALSTIDVTTATANTNSPFMICRRCESTGDISYSYTFGHWTKTLGFGAIAMGISTTANDLPSHEKVTAAGRHAVNISANSGSQTTGHGAYGDYSAIIGGQDHDIPSTSSHTVILGGSAIKARASSPNQVYVPSLNIVSTPATDNTLTEVLVRDGATSGGPIKLRTLSSFVANGLRTHSGAIKLGSDLTESTLIGGNGQDLSLGSFGNGLDLFEVHAADVSQVAGSTTQNTKIELGSTVGSITANNTTTSFSGGVYVATISNLAAIRSQDATDMSSVDVMPDNVLITSPSTVFDSKTTFDKGVNQGTGIKHKRITTGSIAQSSSSTITLSWDGATFGDTNYTCTCSVEDATASTNGLRLVHIEGKTATTVTVRVENLSNSGAITGTLNCIAFHD